MTALSIHPSARWIWPEGDSWDIHNGYAQFRKAFDLDAVPRRAPAWITADQSYHLWVNGEPVSRGPARGFQDSWPCDEVDLAPYLRKGRNVIAVRAYNPGHGTFAYISQLSAGFLFSAKWGKFTLVSDSTWRMRRQTGVRKDSVPSSLQLVHQEHLDARIEPTDWMHSDFDDSVWKCDFPAQRNLGSMPWRTLEPRGIPLLEEKDILPVRLLGTGQGKAAADAIDTRDVLSVHAREDLSHTPVDAASATRAGLERQTVPPAGKGRFKSFLFDFGRTVVGCPQLHVLGAQGGEICDVLVYETIDAATLKPHIDQPNWSRIAMAHRLVCAEGENRHEFHLPFGFRYLELVVRENRSPLEVAMGVRWIGYPLPHKGSFASSDAVLEKIWQASAWTQQCCSLDAYVDTPWREQAQWWGDARVQAWNTFHLNGDPRLFRRGIAQIARQTTPEGLTYGHAPTIAHGCILPDFTLVWFLTLWDYYWQTGSIEPFHTHRKTVEKALVYFEQRLHPDHDLLPYDERYWLFLDWTGIFKEGYPALYSLWFLHAVRKLRALYALLPAGEKKAAGGVVARLGKLEQRVGRGLAALVGKDGLLHDGLTWKGKRVPETSIHTQTLAITVGLDRKNDHARLDRILRPYVRGEYDPAVQPSAYWITYVFIELIAHGHGDEVVACIRRRWETMAEHGTTWETFAPKVGSESHSHAWSAHPLYHLMQTVGGVIQTAPAWKEIEYRPVFHGDHGQGVVPTPRGLITTKWQRNEGVIDVWLQLPRGVTARVILPGTWPKSVKGRASFKISQSMS
jgi:alpha-L-rhamnosidase